MQTSFLLALGPAVAKIFEPVTLPFGRFLKDKVLPPRVATDVKPVVARSWPGQQHSRLPPCALEPTIAVVSQHLVFKITAHDLVEVGGRLVRRINCFIALALDFTDDLCNVSSRDLTLKWNGTASTVALCLPSVSGKVQAAKKNKYLENSKVVGHIRGHDSKVRLWIPDGSV